MDKKDKKKGRVTAQELHYRAMLHRVYDDPRALTSDAARLWAAENLGATWSPKRPSIADMWQRVSDEHGSEGVDVSSELHDWQRTAARALEVVRRTGAPLTLASLWEGVGDRIEELK